MRSLSGEPVGLRPEILEEAQRIAVDLAETNPRFAGGALNPENLADPEIRQILADRRAIRAPRDLDAEIKEAIDIIGDVDITQGVGAFNQFVMAFGSKFDKAANLLGGLVGKNIDPGIATEEMAAFNTHRTLAVQNLLVLLESQPGKDNVQLQTKMESLLTNIEQDPGMSPSTFAALLKTSLLYNKQVQQSLIGNRALEDLTNPEFEDIKQIAVIGATLERVISDIEKQADPQIPPNSRNLQEFYN